MLQIDDNFGINQIPISNLDADPHTVWYKKKKWKNTLKGNNIFINEYIQISLRFISFSQGIRTVIYWVGSVYPDDPQGSSSPTACVHTGPSKIQIMFQRFLEENPSAPLNGQVSAQEPWGQCRLTGTDPAMGWALLPRGWGTQKGLRLQEGQLKGQIWHVRETNQKKKKRHIKEILYLPCIKSYDALISFPERGLSEICYIK